MRPHAKIDIFARTLTPPSRALSQLCPVPKHVAQVGPAIFVFEKLSETFIPNVTAGQTIDCRLCSTDDHQ